MMLTRHPDMIARYPELNTQGEIPGYVELKEKYGYDPHFYLTVQIKDGAPMIYPWNPPPSPVQKEKNINRTNRAGKGKKGTHHSASVEADSAVTGSGTVKWFNEKKGFGFIKREKDTDLFVHHSQIQMKGFKTLREGEKVRFELGKNKGKLCAVNVKVEH